MMPPPSYLVLFFLLFSSAASADVLHFTPSEILDLARQHNPGIAVYEANKEVAEGLVRQAGTRLNPEVEGTLGSEQARNGGNSGGLYGFSIAQPLEIPARRRTRQEAARKEKSLSEAEERLFQLGMYGDVQRSVYTLLHYQMLGRHAEENAELAQQIQDTVASRVEGGEAPQADSIRARVEALKAAREARSMQRRLAAERAVLNALCGGALPPMFAIDESNAFNREIILPAGLEERHPQLEVARAEVRLREAEVERERAARYPNVRPAISYERDPGSDTYAAHLGMEVPLWSRGGSSVFRSQAELARAEAAYVREEVALRFRREQARELYMNALEQVEAFETGLREAAKDSFRAQMRLYDAGEIGFLQLLDARRTARQTEAEYLLALYESAISRLELEMLQAGE